VDRSSEVAVTLSRFRGRSFAELRERGRQALSARLERLQLADGRANQRRTSRAPRLDLSAERWFASFAAMREGACDIAAALAHADPQTARELDRLSDDLQSGVVALMGHEPLQVGTPPHWHIEASKGLQIPRKHWSLIDHLDVSVVGDHKIVWELNRQQYLLAPAFCWALDREPRRFELIQAHLESWLDENPRGVGINWASSLEVAYRAITWCWLLWLLRRAPWRPELKTRLLASLAEHASHIERYLSTYFSPNTHLTGEALGLFYLGTLLREERAADRWRAKGAAILEACLQRQVHPDGVYFEQATQYQRYTVEIYLHYRLLADSTGWNVSPAVSVVLGRLCDVLRSVCDASGRMPLIGDDDGGLLLPLDQRAPDDIAALLLAAAVTLGRPELAIAHNAPRSLAYWLCGVQQTEAVVVGLGATPEWLDMHFTRGGVATLRDGWRGDSAVAVIDAGPHGWQSCGHSHADALSMTLALGPTQLFIDRGTLTYTGPERNEFRSTASHNTLEIDSESSATPGEAFRWIDVPSVPRATVYTLGDFTAFVGVTSGHLRSGRPSTHGRIIAHQRGGAWVIRDRADRADAKSATIRWQLAAELMVELREAGVAIIRNRAGAVVAVLVSLMPHALRTVTREVSSRMGHRAQAVCLELDLKPPFESLVVVIPATAAVPAQPRRLTFEGIACIEWDDPNGRQRLGIASAVASEGLPLFKSREMDLIWWTDRSAKVDMHGFEPDLVLAAAMPRSEHPHLCADPPATVGAVEGFEKAGREWRNLPTHLPRRDGA
jgi:hypothetical protein